MEFELPDFDEITPDGKRLLLEKIVKHNGIWVINKSDSDDVFPSDPHGDRKDKPEKLNLYTGEVYSAVDKRYLYTVPKKAMRYIYAQLMKCKEEDIKVKIQSSRDDITYLQRREAEDGNERQGQGTLQGILDRSRKT
jgi:hypothetical protein